MKIDRNKDFRVSLSRALVSRRRLPDLAWMAIKILGTPSSTIRGDCAEISEAASESVAIAPWQQWVHCASVLASMVCRYALFDQRRRPTPARTGRLCFHSKYESHLPLEHRRLFLAESRGIRRCRLSTGSTRIVRTSSRPQSALSLSARPICDPLPRHRRFYSA
jgi:hypothetical protein